MKLTKKILHLPPYLSTKWEQVSAISYDREMGLLIINLKDGSRVEIPSLTKEIISEIFALHAEALEQPSQAKTNIQFGLPFPIDGLPTGFSGIESLQSMMQHNPSQKDAPPLPVEVLAKISAMAKAFGLDKMEEIPNAEPHCNCTYCQLIRAIQKPRSNQELENSDELVSDEELKFRTWDIEQKAEKLFSVSNPLDKKESYNVFLGEPLGCTCGKNNCEHIRAVLNS